MYRRSTLILVSSLLMLSGCASVPEAPTAQMGASRIAVEQARQAGAAESAPADFAAARDKLARAEAAYRAEDYVYAWRLAREAEADAQLAQAKASSSKAQLALNEIQAGNTALQAEINRVSPSATIVTPPATVVSPPATVIVPASPR